MAKDNIGKTVTTRNSSRNTDKLNKIGQTGQTGKDIPSNSVIVKNQRHSTHKQTRQPSSPVDNSAAGSHRAPLQPKPVNNGIRASPDGSRLGNRTSPSIRLEGKSLRAATSSIPRPKPSAKVNSDLYKKPIDKQPIDNSQFSTDSGVRNSISPPTQSMQSDINMSGNGNNENSGPKAMNNMDMWASLMAKLESMQKEQAEALQGIREEIKATNSGFVHDISQIREEIKDVRSTLQGHDSKLEGLDTLKQKLLEEVQQQIEQQIEQQVASRISEHFSSQAKHLEENITQVSDQVVQLSEKIKDSNTELRDAVFEKTDDYLANFTEDMKRDFLKEKRFNRRLNLILMGLPELQEEEEEGDESVRVTTLLKERLSLTYLKIDAVYRLGVRGKGKRPRPIMMMFSKFSRRKAVWFSKSKLNEDQDLKLRIQEDLPPQLRWEMNFLLKIQRQAKSKPETYPNVRIKDYKIILNGTSYGIEDEHLLPQDLRLSAIATPQSADAVAFFGRDSPFSNHFQCDFEAGGLSFNCVEQYLAYHKAKLANNRGIATKVMRASDPAEHKRALNSMKDAIPDEWKEKAEGIILGGLRAKFRQNEHLSKLLLATHPRKLGEASRDPVWGTGFQLNDDKVLDVEAWNKEGNLLGRSLEKVREELIQQELQGAN